MIAQSQAEASRQRVEQAYNIEEPVLDEQRSGFFASYAIFPVIAFGALAFAAWELFG